jgi:hypothetical protein
VNVELGESATAADVVRVVVKWGALPICQWALVK